MKLSNYTSPRFWEEKSLDEMSDIEWEMLCDGCGRCCLVKLQDEDDETIYYTDIACRLLEIDQCRCNKYAQRHRLVDECLDLKKMDRDQFDQLPPTCAYRLINQGEPLYDWHPLLSGHANSVHTANLSVRGKVISEIQVDDQDWEDHVVDWPLEQPDVCTPDA